MKVQQSLLFIVLAAGVFAQEGEPEIDMEEMQRQEASMKQTACLVLSRYHSNAYKELIEEVVGQLQPDDQSKYINKMYAMAVEKCFPVIGVEEAQLVLDSLMIVLLPTEPI